MEYAGILPAVPFLTGILVYNITTLLLKKMIAKTSPVLFRYLDSDRTHLLDPFLAFATGWLITLFSAPICTVAALNSTHEATLFDQTPEPTLLQQICVGSRVVLWVGETPRLEFSSMYTAHHIFSIAAFLGIVHVRAPLQQLFVLYAALGTELVSTAIALLKVLGWKVSTSKVVRSATYLNVLLLLSIRVPSTCWCLWLVVSSATGGLRLVANVGALLIYTVYLLYCAYRQAQTLGILRVEWRAPAHVLVFSRLTISFYTICLLYAWIASLLSTMWVYSMSSEEPLNLQEAQDITTIAAKVAIIGLVGAAGIPKLFGAKILPEEKRPTCASRGLWLQAGELSMVLTLLLSRFGDAHQYRALICAASLTLPLGEAIGRLGCYFGGCCDRRVPGSEGAASDILVNSVPLTSSWINCIVFLSMLYARAKEIMGPEHTACLAVALNGMTRIFTDSLRGDIPRLQILAGQSPTTVVAFLQLSGALVIFSRLEAVNRLSFTVAVTQYPASLLVAIGCPSLLWALKGTLLQRTGLRRLSKSVNFVVTVLARPLALSSLAALVLGAMVLVEGYKIRIAGSDMN